MKNLVLFFAIFLSFTMTKPAKALLYVEPVVSYQLGSEFSFSINNMYGNRKQAGLLYGGRLGLSFGMGPGSLIVGGEYLTGSTSSAKADTVLVSGGVSMASTDDSDYTQEEMGLFIGYKMPFITLRGGYILQAKETSNKTLSITGFDFYAKDSYFKGTGISLGASITGIVPFISFNFDYKLMTWDKALYKDSSVEGATINSVEGDYMQFGISFPFDF